MRWDSSINRQKKDISVDFEPDTDEETAAEVAIDKILEGNPFLGEVASNGTHCYMIDIIEPTEVDFSCLKY